MSPHPALHGVVSILQLPYHPDGSVDFETLRREIDWVFSHGVDAVGLAQASEVARLTDTERDAVVAAVARHTAGRGPVLASVGAESSAQAVRHARAAHAAGATVLMAIPPALHRGPAEALVAYYEDILAATPLPLVIQDASGYLGQPVPVDAQAELYRRHGDRVMFKPEAPPRGATLSALRDATGGRAAIFEGTGGSMLMDAYPRGIRGTMPGGDIPWAQTALWCALAAGDMDRASAIHAPIAVMVSMMHNLDAFLAVFKLLLREQGVFRNTLVRPPHAATLDPETRREILRLFTQLRRILPDLSRSAGETAEMRETVLEFLSGELTEKKTP